MQWLLLLLLLSIQADSPIDLVADLLFTCCVPATRVTPVTVVSPPPPPQPPPQASLRREDIDHRNNEVFSSTLTHQQALRMGKPLDLRHRISRTQIIPIRLQMHMHMHI